MTLVDDARAIALEAHKDQVDKAGAPYIRHVERVAARVDGDELKTIAYLHDVLEDHRDRFPESCLREKFPERIVDAVVAISKRERGSEPYDQFIERVAQDPLATQVKLADLADNLSRKESIRKDHVDRYESAQAFLRSVVAKGDGGS